MRGQLYKIPARHLKPDYDPAGDTVVNQEDEVCGFVIRKCDDKRLLIVLFRPMDLAKNAEIILEYCDPVSILQAECARSQVLARKLRKIAGKLE